MSSGRCGARGALGGLLVVLVGMGCSSAVEERPDPEVAEQVEVESEFSEEIPEEIPSEPCDGEELSLAEAMEHCRVTDEVMRPPAEGLAITVDPLRFVAGEPSSAVLRLRNTTDEPMEVRIQPDGEFSTALFSNGQQVDGPARGAVVAEAEGDSETILVTIQAGGALSAEIDIPTGAGAGTSPGQAMAPGTYQLRIGLPWQDEQGAAYIPYEAEVDVELTP